MRDKRAGDTGRTGVDGVAGVDDTSMVVDDAADEDFLLFVAIVQIVRFNQANNLHRTMHKSTQD